MKTKGIGRQKAFEFACEQQSHEGEPQLNTATYTQTYADSLVLKMMEILTTKNAVNKSDYPEITKMEAYCLRELAILFGLQAENNYIGTSTVGSSEACYSAGLAMLVRWKEHQKSAAAWRTPNLIISAARHVCWDKFATYHGIQLREIPVTLENPGLDPNRAIELIDQNTIGIVSTLGSTHLGLYDDIKTLNRLLEEFNKLSCFPIFIHVDAASGGLYAPFVDPDYVWDFRLKNVASINVSGHKYGLCPASIGFVIWRSKTLMPNSLRHFTVPYLGGQITTLGVNFSKPAAHIGVQYMEFLGRGREGYVKVHNKTKELGYKLYNALEEIPELLVINPPKHLPVVCWTASPANIDLHVLDKQLKIIGGWHVPTYPLPRNIEHVVIQRFVCRADLTDELVDKFVADLQQAIHTLSSIRSAG